MTGTKKFTQTEVDAILAGRLAKFSDYDAIKAELAGFKAAQDGAVTEARDSARAETLTEVNTRLVNAEARAQGWRNPDDAHRYVNLTDADGVIDADTVQAALTDAATERPDLVQAPPPVPAPSAVGIGTQGAPRPRSVGQQWAEDIGAFR